MTIIHIHLPSSNNTHWDLYFVMLQLWLRTSMGNQFLFDPEVNPPIHNSFLNYSFTTMSLPSETMEDTIDSILSSENFQDNELFQSLLDSSFDLPELTDSDIEQGIADQSNNGNPFSNCGMQPTEMIPPPPSSTLLWIMSSVIGSPWSLTMMAQHLRTDLEKLLDTNWAYTTPMMGSLEPETTPGFKTASLCWFRSSDELA